MTKQLFCGLAAAALAMATFVFTATAADAALWTPADITTAAWFDASDASTITASAGSVSQWDDRSGNGNHVTQATGSSQPATGSASLNGLNVLAFDGGDHLKISSAPLTTQPSTIFVVTRVRALGLGGRQYVFDGITSEANRNLLALERSGKPSIFGQSWLAHTDSTTTNYSIYECTYNGASSVIGINADRVSGNAGSYTLGDGIVIGANRTGNLDFLDGYVAELIVYDGAMLADTRQVVEGYLAWKWDLVDGLPSDHPYKTDGSLFVPEPSTFALAALGLLGLLACGRRRKR